MSNIDKLKKASDAIEFSAEYTKVLTNGDFKEVAEAVAVSLGYMGANTLNLRIFSNATPMGAPDEVLLRLAREVWTRTEGKRDIADLVGADKSSLCRLCKWGEFGGVMCTNKGRSEADLKAGADAHFCSKVGRAALFLGSRCRFFEQSDIDGDAVEAANPYGCNQYGEGWAEPHEGKSTKYEQTGFSGKQSKMLMHQHDGNTVSVATKEKKPGKSAYPDASEEGLAKAAEHSQGEKKPKEKHEIGKAVDREEAIEHAKEILGEGGTVDFHESVPLEMINETNATVAGLKAKYGLFALEMLGSTDTGKDNCGAVANMKRLRLNHDKKNGGIHSLAGIRTSQETLDAGYTRYNVGVDENGMSIRDLVTHEFGHVIHGQLSVWYNTYKEFKQQYGDITDELFAKRGMTAVIDVAKKWEEAMATAQENKFHFKVSRYAMTDDREFFSECFAMRERGEELPEYLTDAMDEVIKVAQATLTRKPKQ